jgi:transmembrane sensor
MKTKKNYTDREWEEIASLLSDEKGEKTDLFNRFMTEDIYDTGNQWKELSNMSSEKEINVDKAWDKVYSRMNESGLYSKKVPAGIRILRSTFLRVAAAALIIIALGSVIFYMNQAGSLSKKITVVTNEYQKNILVSLPDGSKIYLNRNSKFSYRANFGKYHRDVKLTGEAFFDISPDLKKPFIIDAGSAKIKVVGTSFNVITNNNNSSVEVFVKTGKVLVSDNTGSQAIQLDPGFVGIVNSEKSEKTINTNPNYLSWKTGSFEYKGEKLGLVFEDLKRVYNMDIVADNPTILDNPWTWTSPKDNLPQDTIIRLICASFNLSYTKDGNVYHLTNK